MVSSAASVDGSSPVSLLVPSPIDRSQSDRARTKGRRSKRRLAADRNIPAVRPSGGRVTQTHILHDSSGELQTTRAANYNLQRGGSACSCASLPEWVRGGNASSCASLTVRRVRVYWWRVNVHGGVSLSYRLGQWSDRWRLAFVVGSGTHIIRELEVVPHARLRYYEDLGRLC